MSVNNPIYEFIFNRFILDGLNISSLDIPEDSKTGILTLKDGDINIEIKINIDNKVEK